MLNLFICFWHKAIEYLVKLHSTAVAWWMELPLSKPARRPGFVSRRCQEFESLSWDWVCVLCVLSCVVPNGGPDILLTTDLQKSAFVFLSSVLVHSLASSTSIWPMGIWVVSPGAVSQTLRRGKQKTKKERKYKILYQVCVCQSFCVSKREKGIVA